MQRDFPKQLLLAGAGALGAMLAWRKAATARKRRRQLVRGEIRPAQSMWSQVGEWCLHTHVALPAHPYDVPPVVLVHGLGVSSTYFLPTAERLGAHFVVYAPDLPGHGKSQKPRNPLDVPELTDALIAWMDAVGIECAILVGHSMGCQIAVDAALRYPSRVDRLVLIGPTTDPHGRAVPQLLKRFVVGGLYERPSLNWLLVKDYGRMGTGLLPEFAFMRADRIEAKLPHVHVPAMLVRGENDTVVPQPWLDEVARLIGTEKTVVIPGMGHAVNYSAAEQLVEAILPFLSMPSSKRVA